MVIKYLKQEILHKIKIYSQIYSITLHLQWFAINYYFMKRERSSLGKRSMA